MPVLPEDFQKYLKKSPDELAALINHGAHNSDFVAVVKSLLDYKLQKGLLDESRKMAWAAIAAATLPILLNLIGHFFR